MGQLGEVLRHTRERRGLTIEQISSVLHVRAGYLEALEQGRLSALPADVYAKGFLKSYSSYLGIDPNPLLDEFQSRRHPGGSPAPAHPRLRYTPRQSEGSHAIIAQYKPGSNLLTGDPHLSQPPRSTRFRPQSTALLKHPVVRNYRKRPVDTRTIAVGVFLLIVASLAAVLCRSAWALLRHSHRPGIASTSRAAIIPENPAAPSTRSLISLTTRATGNVLWKVTTDLGSQSTLRGESLPGEHETFHGARFIRLYADRGSNLSLTLNGKSLGPLSDKREPITVTFTPRSATISPDPATP